MSYARTIKFITTAAEEELLDIPEVKEAIKDMTNCKTEDDFQRAKSNGILMSVDIFAKNTRVKINDGIYNDLIENAVYSTDNITRIYSIKLEAESVSGTIVMRMRGEQ